MLELAKKKGVLMFGAPTVVSSPQFAFMAEVLKNKRLGRVAAAHAVYRHYGPSWSTFFTTKTAAAWIWPVTTGPPRAAIY